MTEPIPGRPDDVRAAADTLAGAAGRFRDLHVAVLGRATTLGDAWTGAAGELGLARIRHDADVLDRAAEACGAAVAPLRTFADELARAQQDWGDGSAMVAQGQAAAAGIGSGAPADVLRDQADQVVTDGVNVMASATDRVQAAHDAAARALDAASSRLLDAVPATTPQVVGSDGTFGDGLWKAGEDALGGIASMAGGTLDRLDPFSDRFGPAWSATGQTVSAIAGDPRGAVRSMVDGTIQQVLDSYRTGGVDEAAGRATGIGATMLGDKGLSGLGKVGKAGELGTVRRIHEAEVGEHTPLVPGGGLQRHEEASGHTLAPERAHVGATDQQLLERLANNSNLRRVSSYYDRATAERSVAENQAANRADVDQWLHSTSEQRGEFDYTHSSPVGRTATAGATPDQIVDVASSRVVLRRDPKMAEGYRVQTSFPNPR